MQLMPGSKITFLNHFPSRDQEKRRVFIRILYRAKTRGKTAQLSSSEFYDKT
jgi:hypothetical protein